MSDKENFLPAKIYHGLPETSFQPPNLPLTPDSAAFDQVYAQRFASLMNRVDKTAFQTPVWNEIPVDGENIVQQAAEDIWKKFGGDTTLKVSDLAPLLSQRVGWRIQDNFFRGTVPFSLDGTPYVESGIDIESNLPPEQQVIAAESDKRVLGWLEDLPDPRQTTVLYHRFVEGLKPRDVLGIINEQLPEGQESWDIGDVYDLTRTGLDALRRRFEAGVFIPYEK